MKTILKKYYYQFKLNIGLKSFFNTGKMSKSAYIAFREVFVLTRGKSNDILSQKISEKIGRYDNISENGVLGFKSLSELNEAVLNMKNNGYYVFENRLPKKIVDEIFLLANVTPSYPLNTETGEYEKEPVLFDSKNPLSPRYEFRSSDIINNQTIQNLIFDSSLLLFAQQYLGVKPILDLLAFWWSIPFQGKGTSAAAQMYHFDLDRIKFLKFFFYITDVDADTGPHCYVKGSHIALPKSINRDGRFSDQQMEEIYGKENMIEICGQRGSIIAVDTRGFHKGKELINNKRLLFQIEFANSMFGQTYPPVKMKFSNSSLEGIAKKYEYTYKQILIEED